MKLIESALLNSFLGASEKANYASFSISQRSLAQEGVCARTTIARHIKTLIPLLKPTFKKPKNTNFPFKAQLY